MKLSRSSFIKLLAALAAILSLCTCAVSTLCAVIVFGHNGYDDTSTLSSISHSMFYRQLNQDMDDAANYYALTLVEGEWTAEPLDAFAERFAEHNSNFFFTIEDYDSGELLLGSYFDDYRCYVRRDMYITMADVNEYIFDGGYAFEYYYDQYGNQTAVGQGTEYAPASDEVSGVGDSLRRHVIITGFVRSDLNKIAADNYAAIHNAAWFLYSCRSTFLFLAASGGIFTVLLLVFLFYGAGRRKGTTAISLRLADRIPADLFTVICGGMAALLVAVFFLGYEDTIYNSITNEVIFFWSVFLLCASTLAVIFLTSFATRLKIKGWWKNSLIWFFLHGLGELFCKPLQQLQEIILAIPLIWKTAAVGIALIVLEILCVAWLYYERFVLPICLLNVAVGFFTLACAAQSARLRQGCKAIADGDGEHRVDTSRMFGGFRRQGEDINRIGAGISVAVEERLKSERFKTELITNVSHDLKTPLTSIVNYVDLLSKLDLPEEAEGYVEILRRQSARLKKLTEDLVEASKASTGNLSVEPGPVNLGELLGQVTAEYEARFVKAQLSPVIQLPEEVITALGDGRYLWRVMDNLLSNVCKYALPGTRVYIDAYTHGGAAFLAVKNISRDRLNVTADELMERFVRGDASRNTEGSGLGLSIAQSLAQLMGGNLTLTVDGDLFKAELILPLA